MFIHSSNRSVPDGENDPDSTDVLWVSHNLHSDGVLHLVGTPHHHNFFTHLVRVDMVDHPLRVEMGKLDGESLESVTLWHVVFNRGLEFVVSEG